MEPSTSGPTTAAGPWKCLYDDYDAGTVFVTRDPQRSQSPLVEGLTIEQGTAIAAALNEAETRQQVGSVLQWRLAGSLTVLTEWAEGAEGEGCHWCLFSEGHDEGCPIWEARIVLDTALTALPPSAPPALDVERLTAVLRYSPIHWEVRRPDGAFVMTRMFESADEAAAYIAAEYARQEPER